MDKKVHLEKEINIQKVIQNELSQLKSSSKIYHKERSSDIFFLSSHEQEMRASKHTLDNLMKEYTTLVEREEKANSGKSQSV